jgi:hypothetical protein
MVFIASLTTFDVKASLPQILAKVKCRTPGILTASERGRIKMQHDRPDFPTMEQVEKANHEQLARWYRFLPSGDTKEQQKLERVQNNSLGCNRLRYRKNASQRVPTTNCVGYNPTNLRQTKLFLRVARDPSLSALNDTGIAAAG